jgi:hypothetical protein
MTLAVTKVQRFLIGLNIWVVACLVRGVDLQRGESCFRDFPDQCEGCPEYRERRYDSASALISMTSMGVAYPQYRKVVVKECRLYHKRRVEPLE